MALDPDVVSYLELLAAADVSPLRTELGELRRGYEDAAPRLFGPVPTVASVEDVDADGVPARIYRPLGSERAALVYLHGGGWVLGGLESHDPLCRALAARSGCAVLSVGYRLAPEHRYPAAIEDAWAATRWAAERFDRLAIAGDSAGGQLAAAVALRARKAGPALALQVLIYPVTDHGCDYASCRENDAGPGFHTAEMAWFWSQYLDDPTRTHEPDCCPIRAPELAGAAPALVLTAENDPLRDEGEAYAERLRREGVQVRLVRYAGLIHGFLRMPAVIGRADEAIELVSGAVASALDAR